MAITPEVILSFVAGAGAGLAVGYGLFRQSLIRDNARLQAENDAMAARMEQHAQQHKGDLAALEGKFALQFENLANRIFDEKTASFKRDSHEGLAQLLAPLRERLNEFQKKVEDSSKEQYSLKNEIKTIVEMNERMHLQTESLTRALKGDVKAQGNWGEIMLEKILEDSGLRKDEDYVLQGVSMGLRHVEGGQSIRPDVIVKLPEDKHIIIDSKVSLTAYERYCATEDELARAASLKEFIASLRNHVAGLESKRYQDSDRLGTPDFVLMFLPVEGAYSLAVQKDPGLHSFAWDKKIVIVCPSTLFATLKTISSVWRLEQQNKNADEIARQGGNLYDKIVGFLEDMQSIGDRLNATQKTYDEAFKKLSTGTGNILKRTQDLKALGLKTSKKLPKGMGHDEDEPPKALK